MKRRSMPQYSLPDLVNYARKHSPYYRLLYAHLPESINSLRELPILDVDNFWKAHSSTSSSVLTEPLHNAIVFKSGGTTGNPKFSYFTYEEWEEFTQAFGQSLINTGLQAGDRVANLFHSGDLYASFNFIGESLKKSSIATVSLPLSGSAPLASILTTVKEFNVNVLAGLPTTFLSFANYLLKQNLQLDYVELLLFGGENLYRDQQKILKKVFPNAKVTSIGYASVDSGLLGSISESPNIHTEFKPYSTVELIDDDTDEPITTENTPGRLIVTNLHRRLMPILRYPVGDRAEWVDYKNKKFRLLGRTYGSIRLGPMNVYLHDLDKIIYSLPDAPLLTHKQLLLTHQDGKNRLSIIVSGNFSTENFERFSTGIKKEFYRLRPDYVRALEANYIHPIDIKHVRDEELRINPRTGKLIPIIDQMSKN